MAVSSFDSFDESELGAFIESPLGARNPGTGDRLLLWPNPRDVVFGQLANYVVQEIAPEWDTHETWTGNPNDYGHVICDGVGANLSFWEDVTEPAWYTAALLGTWTGRIQLGAIRARTLTGSPTDPRAAHVRAFMNPLAEAYDMGVTTDVIADNVRPFNGSVPEPDQPLTEGVATLGRGNFDGAFLFGTCAIAGTAASLANQGGQSYARHATRLFQNTRRISVIVSGDGLTTAGDPGPEPNPYKWLESSLRFARNFWDTPL